MAEAHRIARAYGQPVAWFWALETEEQAEYMAFDRLQNPPKKGR